MKVIVYEVQIFSIFLPKKKGHCQLSLTETTFVHGEFKAYISGGVRVGRWDKDHSQTLV